MIGEVVGSYRIDSVLGRGGMGIVYRAEHVQLGRPVALKMLQQQFTHDASIVQRFFNEARAASAIEHSGIVEVFDYGLHTDGRAYLVMALLKGATLGEHLEQRVFDPREASTIVAQIASVLAAAHAAGIVHRDLKPDNIVLVPNELSPIGLQVKLLDFGIAKLAHDPQGFKTQTGVVLGTPLYMSPEQCTGTGVDHRSDLYSLGCILYHMLAGRPPFEGVAAGAIIAAHLRDEAPDPRTFVSTIPDDLVAITMRLLAKDPAARLPSALAVRDALGGMTTAPHAATAYSLPRYVPGPVTTATNAAAQVVPQTRTPRRSLAATFAFVLATIVLTGATAYVVSSRGESPRAVAALPPPPAGAQRGTERASDQADQATERPHVHDNVTDHPSESDGATARASHGATDRALDRTPDRGTPARSRDRSTHRTTEPRPDRMPEPIPEPIPDRAEARTRDRTEATKPPPRMRITLGATRYAPGARIDVEFPSITMSLPDARAWLAIAEVGKPSPAPGTWTHVEHGARRVGLPAPVAPGRYEVRLYRNLELQVAARFVVDTAGRHD